MSYGYVYLLCNHKTVHYIWTWPRIYRGVCNNINLIITPKSFTAQYDVTRLVWFDKYDLVADAIRKEKTMKAWSHQWKINLIEQNNPNWDEIILDYDG